jgi:hypothetical protein
MATYGIAIGIPQLTLMLLANIKMATKSDYSREFCLAMHAICKKYMYNCVHNADLLQIILKELVGADGVRYSRTHQHQAQEPHIQLQIQYPASKQ